MKRLFKDFDLSEKGERDLRRGIGASFLANLSLMLPVGVLVRFIGEIMGLLQGQEIQLTSYIEYGLLLLVLMMLIYGAHSLEYELTYLASYKESAERRIRLAEKLRQLPLSFFGNKDLAEVTNAMMNDCTSIERTFSHAIPQLFGSILCVMLISVPLAVLDWRLALAIFAVLPLALLLVIGTKKIQENLGLKKIEKQQQVSDDIQSFLENIQTIKACRKQEETLKNIEENLEKTIQSAMKFEMITGSFIASAQMVLRLGLVVVIALGAYLLSYGEIDVMTYIIFLIAAARIYDPLSLIMMQLGEIFNAQLQIQRMRKILNEKAQTGSPCFEPQNYDVVFEEVDFAYGKGKNVLNQVSFTAKQGEITALVGPSGSGKSTISKLAARFWDVNQGKIMLGGEDIGQIEPETLLKSYAIVFQDVVLFNGTIRDNIRIGNKDASEEEVIEAAKLAQCHSFIEKLEKGYDTMLGENGANLSGGERQRLSIARALLKDAPVILLDEATASLDAENETAFQRALAALIEEKTVIVIAHRLRTIMGADQVVVLEEGRVIQKGHPLKIAAEKGLFKHMIDIQKQNAEWAVL